MTTEEKLDEIRGHLGAALAQSLDSDDLEWLSSQCGRSSVHCEGNQ
jgi:hypothetical protein